MLNYPLLLLKLPLFSRDLLSLFHRKLKYVSMLFCTHHRSWMDVHDPSNPTYKFTLTSHEDFHTHSAELFSRWKDGQKYRWKTSLEIPLYLFFPVWSLLPCHAMKYVLWRSDFDSSLFHLHWTVIPWIINKWTANHAGLHAFVTCWYVIMDCFHWVLFTHLIYWCFNHIYVKISNKLNSQTLVHDHLKWKNPLISDSSNIMMTSCETRFFQTSDQDSIYFKVCVTFSRSIRDISVMWDSSDPQVCVCVLKSYWMKLALQVGMIQICLVVAPQGMGNVSQVV